MRVAIMQPYFLPYIGYFQLIGAVDTFVVYDNIKYTKKGWINRNRMLKNGSDLLFSLPLAHASDSCFVSQRALSPHIDKQKLLNQIREAYRRAPHFEQAFELIRTIIDFEDANLFNYIMHSIRCVCAYLNLTTSVIVSSSLDIDHSLKSQEKVIAICTALGAKQYINPEGGVELYSQERFENAGIDLKFLRANPVAYPQFGSDFVPFLSILDLLMFQNALQIRAKIQNEYQLFSGH